MQFYYDWLEVADEEIKHFKLLNSALKELGYKYGNFPVHDNLESALEATKDSLSFRMGVVHRGLEAKGLDANPFVVQKLQSSNHSIKNLLMEYLEIILNDEIKHVKKEILGGNLQIKTGMILLSFAKRLNNSLLREKT